MKKTAIFLFAIFLSGSAHAGFPLKQCHNYAYINNKECSAQATIDNSKTIHEMDRENLSRAYASLYEHIQKEYGKTPSVPNITPASNYSNADHFCITTSDNYKKMQHQLFELIKQRCQQKGNSCGASSADKLESNLFVNTLLQTKAGTFYVLFEKHSPIIITPALKVISKGTLFDAIDREKSIIRSFKCTGEDAARKCTVEYSKLSPEGIKVLKSVSNPKAPDSKIDEQFEYEFSILFNEQKTGSPSCAYIVY